MYYYPIKANDSQPNPQLNFRYEQLQNECVCG